MTVRLTGCPKRYAACLTTVATLPGPSLQPMEAVGVLSTPALTRRVVRILSRRRLASPAFSAAAAVLAVLVLGAFSVTAAGHRVARTIGSEPRVEVSSTTETGSQPQPAPVIQHNPSGDADGGRPSSASTRAQSVAAVDQAPATAITDASPRVTTETSAPQQEPSGSATSVTAPALMPLAASASSVPVIDKPALPEPLPAARRIADPLPWSAVADAGVSVGQGSKQAGVATGRFFSRLSKKIAGSF
jgi:hypothetical protein